MTKKVIYPPKDYQAPFCRFIFRYGQLEGIKTDKTLNTAMGRGFTGTLNNIIGKSRSILITKTRKEMEKVNLHNCIGEILYYTCSDTKSISLLRHLRNSIAHGNIHQDGKYFIIKDYYNSKNKKLSAYGKIQIEKIREIVNEYTKV